MNTAPGSDPAPPGPGIAAALRDYGHAVQTCDPSAMPGEVSPHMGFGSEPGLQLLFESWIKRETWLLRRDGLALLAGVDPEAAAELGSKTVAQAEEALWSLLREAVAAGTLRPLNPEAAPGDWRVTPAALYDWACRQGIPLPEAYTNLMRFILKVLGGEAVPAGPAPTPEAPEAGAREAVLGAALALVATYPEQCRGEEGWIEALPIARQIEQKRALWFEGAAPMPVEEMATLIERWLKTL